jgi:YD repeat-containing protein
MTINGAELGESLLLSGGTFEVTAAVISVASGTTLTIPADTELKLSGTATLTVAEGATLTVEEEATLTNEGTITFGAGSTLTGTLTNTGTIKTADETILASLLDSANGVTAGTVEASESLEIASATVKSGVTLKIASGKRLTVTGTLTIQSSASVTGAAGAKIELGAAATHSGTVNFYYSDGETAHSSSIPADTYTWVSTIGGSGGWKATDETDPPLAAEQETADAGDVAGLLAADGVTQVTYTGSDPLTGITVPANKTLNITGAIVGQTDAITVDTDGTATSSNTITTSNSINAAGLTSLVKLGGNGTIKLAAEVTGVETTLELSQNLEIGNSGSIAFADTFTSAAFNGSGSLTLSGSGAISLGSGVTSLGKTVTFAAGAEGTVTTGNAPALAAIVNAATSGNKITATGSLTPASDITVAEGVTLTIANGGGALIVDSGRTLTVNGTITTTGTLTNSNIIVIGENGSISDYTKVTNSGTIKTAYATVLTTLLSNVTAGTVEVTGTDASLAGGTVQGTATLKVSGTLTVNGAITATGTITNEGIIVLGSSGSITDYGQVTNNGTIKTSQVAKLTELLTSGVTAGTVEVTGSGITIGEDTTITVPGNVTLAIGNATDTATLTLGSYTTSKLVLSPTAKLAVLNGASEFAGVATVGVAGTNNKATFESEGGLPPIWTVTDDESGTDSTTVTLGTLVLTVSSGVVTTTAQGGSTAASLEAGEGTTITFAGAGA